MNTKQQGDIGVSKAVYYYTAKGYAVSIPLTDNTKYDLIVDDGNSLKRIQIKTTTYKTKYDVYQVMLKTSGGNQSWSGTVSKLDSKNFELLFILTENGDMYEFTSDEVDGRSTINLGPEKQNNRVELDRW